MPNKSRSDMSTKMTKKQLQDRITELERTNGHLNFYVHELTEIVDKYKKLADKCTDSMTETNKILALGDNLTQKIKKLHEEITNILLDSLKKKDRLYKHYKKISRKRESTKEKNTEIRNAKMLQHFQELLAQEEDPNGYGVLTPLRRQTYNWAVEQKLFNSEKTCDTPKTPLSDRQLAGILPMPGELELLYIKLSKL